MARFRFAHYAVAIAAHGAALFAVSRVPLPPAPPNDPIAIGTLEEFLFEELAVVPQWNSAAAVPEPSAARVAVAEPRAPADEDTRMLRSVDAPSEQEGVEGERAPSRPPVITVTPPSRAMHELGIGRANPFLPRSEQAVARAESKRAIDRALKDPARERDREVGLGPAGPVVNALNEATARSTAPVRGRAVFIVTTDDKGAIAIELRDSEGGRRGWDDARRVALEALKSKKLRLPPGATRAVMRLEVTSGWKLPGGQDPGTNWHVLRTPVAEGESKDATNVSVLDPVPKLVNTFIPMPNGTKIPIIMVEFDLFATKNADPANFGSTPRRIVHTHVIETEVM
jgi:hypothetical protein